MVSLSPAGSALGVNRPASRALPALPPEILLAIRLCVHTSNVVTRRQSPGRWASRSLRVKNRWWLVPAIATMLALPAGAQDKDTFTPMPLDAGFGKLDLTEPATAPEEIIKKFAAKESEFREALNHYTYRR